MRITRAGLAGGCAALALAVGAAAQVDTVLPEDDDSAAPEARATMEGRSYPDGAGGEVYFPLGAGSFADQITQFMPGQPSATRMSAMEAAGALGEPDYDPNADRGYVTLGCGGALIAQFEDNVLVDVEGDDLYIYEIGENAESMRVAISADGEEWTDLGEASGGTSAIDIAGSVEPSDAFRYVRLQDAGEACGPSWPGADIDAIGAIGGGQRILLESAVLFDFDQASLHADAVDALRSVNAAILAQENARVVIEGYTDQTGAEDYNIDLSQRRADAVREHLESLSDRPQDTYVSVGRGEANPIASNESDEGAAENRRVEILILTPQRSG